MWTSFMLITLNEEPLDKPELGDMGDLPTTPAMISDHTPHLPDSSEVREFVLKGGVRTRTQPFIFITFFTALEYLTRMPVHTLNRSGLGAGNAQLVSYLNVCYFHVIRLYRRVARRFTMYTFMYLLLTSLISKDLVLVRHFFEEKFKNLRFKKHRRILSMLRYVFRVMLALFIHHNLIKGFRMEISGKIGAAGSVKKKTWAYRNGRINLSAKKDLLKYEVGSLWTQSGCLGLHLYLAY